MRLTSFAAMLLFGVLAVSASGGVLTRNASKPVSHSADAPYAVASGNYSWLDPRRNRQVPAKIYYPAQPAEAFPVIIFSPGLGRSREDCEYLGNYWAGHGYVSVHLQHLGSDETVWQGKLRPMKALHEAYEDSSSIYQRLHDVTFAIDQLERMRQQQTALGRRLDLQRLGAAGHDLGAETVLALAGQALPRQTGLVDPRVKAIVAMSPPVSLGEVPLVTAYSDIHIPCLHITGTEDDGVVGTTRAPLRRVPFDYIHGDDQFLITFLGGDHMTYSGHKVALQKGRRDALFQRLICISSTAFWNGYLKGDPDARTWLADRGLDDALGNAARLEKKLAASPIVPAE